MSMAFDTLGYVRRLQEARVDRQQAEAHPELARDMILADLVTKRDLERTNQDLEKSLKEQELKLTIKIGALITAAVGFIVAAQRIL